MKPSNYNFIYPYQFNRDYSVVYNTYLDTVAIVTAREAEFIQTCNSGLGIHDKKTAMFREKGFVVDRNFDELSVVKVSYMEYKFDKKMLTVVIVPTYQCNLSCEYCYEKLSYGAVDNTIMTKQAQDNIFDAIEARLDGVEKLAVFWHGGEPLVALNVVERLGGKLQQLAAKRGMAFTSRMSTNGYLFTPDVAMKLQELGITHYKMSIDGKKGSHDCKKKHRDGGDTYDVILDNITKSVEFVEEIDLRININKKELKDAYDILEMIENSDLKDKVIPRLGRPQNFATEANEETFTEEEYMYEAVRYSLVQGIGPSAFTRKDCFCIINKLNAMIVDNNGKIFKCVADSGDGQAYGRIEAGGIMNLNQHFYKQALEDPTTLEKCEHCKFLPICVGECGQDRKMGNSCTYASIREEDWAKLINAYVVKRLLHKVRGGIANEL